MNEALALHTAARRYCLERYSFWYEKYSEIVLKDGERQADGYHYTPEALATFPRYNILNAILVELESIDPCNLEEREETRELMDLAGKSAEVEYARIENAEKIQESMGEERESFCRYIRGLTLTDLNAVEALPFRRVLSREESEAVWSRLRKRWKIPANYWYPLADCALQDVVAFKADAFNNAVETEHLQKSLATHGIVRVWELKEYGPEYEQDVSLLKPYYNECESYWSSRDLDWIIYASHEDSITVAGWLLNELKTIWSSWELHLWTGYID